MDPDDSPARRLGHVALAAYGLALILPAVSLYDGIDVFRGFQLLAAGLSQVVVAVLSVFRGHFRFNLEAGGMVLLLLANVAVLVGPIALKAKKLGRFEWVSSALCGAAGLGVLAWFLTPEPERLSGMRFAPESGFWLWMLAIVTMAASTTAHMAYLARRDRRWSRRPWAQANDELRRFPAGAHPHLQGLCIDIELIRCQLDDAHQLEDDLRTQLMALGRRIDGLEGEPRAHLGEHGITSEGLRALAGAEGSLLELAIEADGELHRIQAALQPIDRPAYR